MIRALLAVLGALVLGHEHVGKPVRLRQSNRLPGVSAPRRGDNSRPEAQNRRENPWLDDICPVVAGYGGRDKLFAKRGRLLKAHLEALGVPHDVKIYDEAGHSYMSRHPKWMMALAPFTPLEARYDEAAAEDSWRRMLAFFHTHLGASP